MEKTNNISEETTIISALVAGIGNQHPYAIPPTYFDGLAMQVLLRIALEEKMGADPVLQINKDNFYQVPKQYFDSLAANIIQRIKAQETGNAREELEMLSPLLGQIGKQSPFTPPEGYFNEFSDNIMAGVKAVAFVNGELENLSPVMAGLKNTRVYEVPEGYFNTTASAIVEKVKQQQPARVVKVGFGRKIMQYAAAAVVTGILIYSGYKYSGTVSTVSNGAASELSKVSDQEIENFLNNNTVSLADIGADTDMLNTTAAEDTVTNEDDTRDLLADISDEALQQYVDQRPETPISN
ncbi:MAG: hypothetical protein ABI813_09890 [Bacteroidota bacterium]